MIDDNDEVYLNGKLIAKYGGKNTDIKTSNYGPRSYVIAVNNPAIFWDRENVFAVRIFDTSGDGGIYGNTHKISMISIMDQVAINTDADFDYDNNDNLIRSIKLTANGNYNYSGVLAFNVIDPETDKLVFEKVVPALLSAGKPALFSFNLPKLGKKSYELKYTFTENRSGEMKVKKEGTPYVLTPYVSAKPRINGPDVYGAKPGNPFLYLIPATGKKPMTYSAAGLPDGLKLNENTGIITGAVGQKGDYPVTLMVHNRYGTKTKKFTIKIGDLIGLTPALGWNSWNAFGLSINDKKVRIAAKTVADKLSAHGWNFVNIDDGWEAGQRLKNGEIATNDKFPDMVSLTGYIHSLGLKMGIYSSPGPKTCGGYLGSWQHEEQDAKTYGNWGIDYLKYDWCSYSEVTAKNPDLADMKKP